MNDASEKGSSCLAITEKKKKNQRPGGCIGSIFFQLFDWNRKLTKKRLFSKKLLPPASAKQAASSKKFKGDEKMPNSKFHLIANENNGGFPSTKKGGNRVIEVEQKHEMRVPGLVVRLMGLESIPTSHGSKKSSFSDGDVEESLDNYGSEADKQGVDLEMGVANAKHDSRPQKLQKTGTYERKAVTRFGTEALQIKSVLSQVRKYNHHHHHHHHHHHPKFISPLKSPRVSSGKSASRSTRLIEAATKILEPGLHATSRAKRALTSSSNSIYPPNNGIMTGREGTRSVDMQNQSGYDASTAKPLIGHTSCKNCGNLLDVVVDCKPEFETSTPIVSDVFTASSLESAQKRRSLIPSHENDVVLLRSQEKIITLVDEDGKNNAESCNESTTRRMSVPVKWDSSCTLEDDGASSFACKHRTQTQERVLSNEKISSGSRTSNMQEKRVSSAASTVSGTKDFVALNRSLSGRTRMRSPTKMDSCKFDLERKPSNRQHDSLSCISTLERKWRTPNVEGTASVNLVRVKQRNASSDAQWGKRRSFDASSPKSYNVKSKRGDQVETDKVNDNKVVSFAYSSPFKQKIVIPAAKEESSSNNEIKMNFQRPPPMRGDALGAFLQQKLKELRFRENGELATDCPSAKSTAMILQELISALNSEHLTCSDDHMFNDKHEANHVVTSCNGNHLSPGSVLEASFSSSSIDEGSGHGFHPDSMNCSYDQLEQDSELLDSATSFNKGKIGCEILTELVNQIHMILQSLNSFWTRLTESKLTHMKEVIFNAELVIGNVTEQSEGGVPQLIISCFLLNELNTMANDAMWRDFNGFVGCEESKERSQLKGFLFDCVIEYLESNCCQHYNSIFKSWSEWIKLPLCMKAEMLVQEVKNEIKKWTCISGMVPDQIIEWEMSHSLGKWTDFSVEAFEVGVDLDGDVLQILVDEIVEDLVDSRQGTFELN